MSRATHTREGSVSSPEAIVSLMTKIHKGNMSNFKNSFHSHFSDLFITVMISCFH